MFNSKALLAALLGFMNLDVALPKPKSSREAIGMPTYTRRNGTHGSTRRRRFKSLKAKGLL